MKSVPKTKCLSALDKHQQLLKTKPHLDCKPLQKSQSKIVKEVSSFSHLLTATSTG